MHRRPARNITLLIIGLTAFLAYTGVARTVSHGAGGPQLAMFGLSVPPARDETGGGARHGTTLPSPATDRSALERAGSAVFRLETEVVFHTGEATPTRVTVEGTGTVLFGRYVLTVAHAVTEDDLEITVPTSHGRMRVPAEAKRISERTVLLRDGERVVLRRLARIDAEDVALFLLPVGGRWPDFPYPIGDSESLDLGDPVALLERDPVAGTVYRPGAVAALRGPAVIAPIASTEGAFLVSFGLTSGESGAPVLAARGGRFELVGLAQGTFQGPRDLAWAVRIRRALEGLAGAGGSPEIGEFLRLCGRTGMASTRRSPEAG